MKVPWKRVVPVLAIAGMLLLPISVATAAVITVDGNIGDWGVNVGAMNSNANPGTAVFNTGLVSGVSWWAEDGAIGSSGYVEPGYGGQNYDVEAMYAYADATGLYVAVVTGFDKGGVYGWQGGSVVDPYNNHYSAYYRPGDIFFDFGNDGVGWDLAVETAGLIQGTQPNARGGVVGNAYSGTGTWWTTPTDFPAEVPSEIIHPTTGDTGLGSPGAFVYSDVVTGGADNLVEGGSPHASGNSADWNRYDHNVIEVYLSSAWLATQGYNLSGSVTVTTHWTEQCGNDTGETPSVTVPQVPEPVTMVMLGCLGAGMLGARAAARRRKTEK
jgi:hypothetical protein